MLDAFRPNRVVSKGTTGLLVAFWLVAFLLLWSFSPWESLPSLGEVYRALGKLWWSQGLGPEIGSTMRLIGHATLLTVVISLGLAYLTVIPFFRPLVESITKLRFLGLTGLAVIFFLLTGGGYAVKVAMLTFAMSTFYLTSMAQVVAEIPRSEFDHMRVLGASELRILWEVVIRGTLDKALDGLRQNVAMGWAMITMVEVVSGAEGGIGKMLHDKNKYSSFAEVYALLVVILVLGLLVDYAMGVLINVICPHARLGRVER